MLDLGWYFRALKRRWTWIVAGGLLGVIAAGAFALSRPRFYEASTTIMVSPPREAAAPVNPQTYRALLENGTLASEIVEELGLAQPPHGLTPQAFLEQALTVEAVANTNVVRLKVRLRDPKVAAEASRRLADKAIALTTQLNQQEGTSMQSLLKDHVDASAERLANAEKALLTFQQSAQVELLEEDTEALLGQRGDLLKLTVAIESEKARLAAAEQEIKRQERVLSVPRAVNAEEALRRADVRETPPNQPPVAATGSGEPRPEPPPQQRDEDRDREKPEELRKEEEKKKEERRTQRAAEAAAPSPDTAADSASLDLTNPFVNPVYQTLDFQIATSRARLAALERQRRELVDVRKLGGEGLGQLSDLYSRQIQLARLQTNFDLAKRVHSDLMVRYEESRTQVLGSSPMLQIVDRALPPDRPQSRRTTQLAALGLAFGLVAAGLLALLVEAS